MPVLLRLGLALLFLHVAVITFLYPAAARSYLDTRYRGFYNFALSNTTIAAYISNNVVAKTPASMYKVIALLIALGGVAILLDRKRIIIVYAYLVMILGGAMHMPYTDEHLGHRVVPQTRKLIFVFGVFFALLLLATITHDKSQSRNLDHKPKSS